jgi:NIPSNAP
MIGTALIEAESMRPSGLPYPALMALAGLRTVVNIGLCSPSILEEDYKMIIEMRTYKLKPNMRARFLEIFRSKSIPEHNRLGMKIVGPFLSVDDPDIFFFMRAFPDLPSRKPLKARFYEGDLWKHELENMLMPMIDKYEAVLVEDSERLIRW